MIRRYLILVVFSLGMLSGCSFIMPTRHNSEMAQAEALIQSGKNKEAATLYKQLAELKSDSQNYYRLLSADALIRANDVKQAKQYINLLDVNALNDEQSNHLSLLQAQIELSQGNAETALTKLKVIQIEDLNNPTKIAYYQSLAFAYSLTGDAIQSAQALINIDPLVSTPKQRSKYYEQILSSLDILSEQDLHVKQPLSNPTLSGWMALANVFKQDESSFAENISKWRKLYPVHPANSAFLSDYLKNYHNLARSPMIALILPESGAYAAPAAVIKKGFMKAYNLAKKTGRTTSEIRFYDSETSSPAKLYQQAIKEGAKLVVGPLDKKDIKALVNSTELSIPVLALNHVEGLNSPKLYQFALSPIDDAEQITVKAHQDGHQNALFLVPKSEQGKRFSGYLTDNWQKLGGNTVSVQAYDDSRTDFSQTAQVVSKQTADDSSVDAILLNAYAKPARALYPQLQKNKTAAALPVYATSQIYLGDADAARDKNLDGVTFCDVPWVFSQAYDGELSKEALHDSWQDLSPSYLRLLPMGIDAYNLIEHLAQLKKQPFSGATGKLKLNGDNRISRELQCAKFANGVPKITDAISENADAAATGNQPNAINQTKPAAPLPELPKLEDSFNSQL